MSDKGARPNARHETTVISTRQLADRAAGVVKDVRDTGHAVIVTEDGEPAAVLVTMAEFVALAEHRQFVAAVEEGLADVDAGRVLSTDELRASLEAEFGPIAWQ